MENDGYPAPRHSAPVALAKAVEADSHRVQTSVHTEPLVLRFALFWSRLGPGLFRTCLDASGSPRSISAWSDQTLVELLSREVTFCSSLALHLLLICFCWLSNHRRCFRNGSTRFGVYYLLSCKVPKPPSCPLIISQS